MPSILNEISFFQFDNLIRNRIPFVILNLGVDLKDFYSMPLYQNHLEALTVVATKESALIELQNRKVLNHDAILVLCPDGQVSAQLVDQLESQGFTNVFFAKSGYHKLKADATH